MSSQAIIGEVGRGGWRHLKSQDGYGPGWSGIKTGPASGPIPRSPLILGPEPTHIRRFRPGAAAHDPRLSDAYQNV